jgi:dihydrofolate reductase
MATVYFTASTLDGYVADPQHSLQWLFDVPDSPEVQPALQAFGATVGSLVMGASTYQWLLDNTSWLVEPEGWATEYGDRRCWVLTHRDLPVIPGSGIEVGPRDVAELHPEAVAAAGDKDVWVMGGGDVAGQFADAGLLDRIVVNVAPVTLGAGAPLLPRRLTSERLSLRSVEKVGQFAFLTYDVR